MERALGFKLSQLNFLSSADIKMFNNEAKIKILRVGFTGEDGFYISVPERFTLELAEKFTEARADSGQALG